MKLTEGEARTLLRDAGIKIAEWINTPVATKALVLRTIERMREFAEELP